LLFFVFSAVLTARAQSNYEPYFFGRLAGNYPGSDDGTGSDARFFDPESLAVDSAGNVYVADYVNSTIRKMTPAAVVSTFAGLAEHLGDADGPGGAARFYNPTGVAVDASGNVYVAGYTGNTIRKITPAGIVSTLAGASGSNGSNDGVGSAARFDHPAGVAVDGAGNIYVADYYNATIRKITPSRVVTTVAGLAGQYGTTDGTGSAARFNTPNSVAVDAQDNIYVADSYSHTIRKIAPGGVVTTFAGLANSPGSTDGTGDVARFNQPWTVAVDSANNVYVADNFNHVIRKITSSGVVTTLAGSAGNPGSADGAGSAARFYHPASVAVNSAGVVYVGDGANNTIRKITPDRVVTTVAGVPQQEGGGSADGTGSSASFANPSGVALDVARNVYVADTSNNTIRKITPAGVVTTLAGLAGSPGSDDGTGSAARFYIPKGVAADTTGNVYVADTQNCTIRKITPTGTVTTLAGLAGSPGNVDGVGSNARFAYPLGLAVDTSGNVYVADQDNYSIRKITPEAVVTTFAAPSANESFGSFGVAVDSAGNVYVPTNYYGLIRKITPEGLRTTVGTAPGATSLAVDNAGNIYVTIIEQNIIQKINAVGVLSTIAGSPPLSGNVSGVGTAARFYRPQGIAADSAGNVYVADGNNHTIRIGHAVALAPQLANISTRLAVGTGDNALIGGFIITGTQTTKIILRAIGPSLTQFGVPGALPDPILELYDSGGALLARNDDWGFTQIGGIIDGSSGNVQDTGLAPTQDRESAMVVTLSQGAYTTIVRGQNNTTGVALVEAFDLDWGVDAKLANISTRGFVQTGDNVMIGGTIVRGSAESTVLIRAIGPSLANFGIPNALADPTLELHDGNGALMNSNDNWRDTQQAEIEARGLAPTNDLESAILATLSPGGYTAIVRGKNDTTGVAVVEAYELGN
jgi:streptogramin lyase